MSRWFRCVDAACEVVVVTDQADIDPRWKAHRIPIGMHLEVRRDDVTVFRVPVLPEVRVLSFDGVLRMDTGGAILPDEGRRNRCRFGDSWWEPLIDVTLSVASWLAVDEQVSLPRASADGMAGVTRTEAWHVVGVLEDLLASDAERSQILAEELSTLRSNIRRSVR